MSKAWLRYKRQDYNNEQRMKLNVTSRASSFKPQYGGTYLVWLTVENNDGLKASSDIWNVTGKTIWYDGNKKSKFVIL